MSAADLPGFDAADPTTWHPANGTVVGVLQAASTELGIRLGANLAPTAERIARALRPPAADLIAEVRRLRAELATAHECRADQCRDAEATAAENERLRALLAEISGEYPR